MKITQVIIDNVQSAEKVDNGIVIEYMAPNPTPPNEEPGEPVLQRTFIHDTQFEKTKLRIVADDKEVHEIKSDSLIDAVSFVNEKLL